MRIGKILVSLPVMAVGMALWKHSLWVVSPDNVDADATWRGLQEFFCPLFSLYCFLVSALILFKDDLLRSLIRYLVDRAWAAEHEPRERHHSEDTTELFY